MPSAKTFHHLEINRVGHGKKCITPPSGKDSDIFGTKSISNPSSPSFGSDKWTIRSNGGTGSSWKSTGSSSPSSMSISGSEGSSPSSSSHGGPSPSSSPLPSRRSGHRGNTQKNLFGAPVVSSPRKIRNTPTIQSSVFAEEKAANGITPTPTNGPKTPVKNDRNVRRPSSKNEDTKNRLFGAVGLGDSPRKIRNTPTIKSTIFSEQPDSKSSSSSPSIISSSSSSTKSPARRSPIDNNVRRPCSKNENQNTQKNLFGPPAASPRKVRVTPTIKSSIFSN